MTGNYSKYSFREKVNRIPSKCSCVLLQLSGLMNQYQPKWLPIKSLPYIFHSLTEPAVFINSIWFTYFLVIQMFSQIPTLPLSSSFPQVGMDFAFSLQLLLAAVLSQT